MSKRLPSNPNLENLKKQAKQLVKDHKDGQVDAFTRIKASFPPLAKASVHEILAADFLLGYAQLVIAREYGYATWKELVEAVERRDNLPKDPFIGKSPALRRVQDQLAQAAPIEMTVLLLGETGTGKGLAARTLHELSPRQAGPLIMVNCGGLPRELVDSELFGHEKGAFTGAHSRRLGRVELAQGGTLFLDEIGSVPLETQCKLLRLLKDKVFERVGGTETLEAEVRVIAASNRDLGLMVAEGAFREDLYYLLQGFTVPLPSLRERREDIPLLAVHFKERMATHLGKQTPELHAEALGVLQAYEWPGNIRELEHVVRRAVIVCTGSLIRREDIALE